MKAVDDMGAKETRTAAAADCDDDAAAAEAVA